jgi:hypothetical protein
MKKRLIIFLLLVFCAGVLRFYGLGQWSFGFDELFTTFETKVFFGKIHVPNELLNNGTIKPEETQYYRLPYLNIVAYYVHWFGYNFFGEDEFGSRFLMAAAGVLSVGVVFLLAQRLFGFVGSLVLALLLMLLPEHILCSQMNRFYSQSFFWIVIVLLLGGYISGKRSLLSAVLIGPVAIIMVLTNALSGVIWGIFLLAFFGELFFSIVLVQKNISAVNDSQFNSPNPQQPNSVSKSTLVIILFVVVWSLLLLGLGVFRILPIVATWNKGMSWGYSPVHAAMSFVNILSWQYSLLCLLGVLVGFLGFRSVGNLHKGQFNLQLNDPASGQQDCDQCERVGQDSAGGDACCCGGIGVYWSLCAIFSGLMVFLLPFKITYNPNYGILFVFPILVSVMIFIVEVYCLFLRAGFPFSRVVAVVWVVVCLLLNFPSLVSYYKDGNRHDNRAAYIYVAQNWQDGDRITGFMMGAAEYYIPDCSPRIPLRDYNIPEKLQEIIDSNKIDSNKENKGRLWVVVQSSRGGLDPNLKRWLAQNAIDEINFGKKRYDYIENNVDVFLIPIR